MSNSQRAWQSRPGLLTGASFHHPLIAPRGGLLSDIHLSSLPRSVCDGLSIPYQLSYILTSSRFHLQWSLLVLFHPLDRDRFQPDPGGRIILEHFPHVTFRQTEQVGVPDRPDGGRSTVPSAAHVQDADLAEVAPGSEGGQHCPAVLGHHLQAPSVDDVHLLSDLSWLKNKWWANIQRQ